MTAAPSRFAVHLRLGRVSNLPTVWTNVIAGVALAGGTLAFGGVAAAALAVSLFYVGGMYLNDAFDARIDKYEKPNRPIVAGHITARSVFRYGFGFLGAGLAVMVALVALGWASIGAVVTAALLGVTVVIYDVWHKTNPVSPVLMGSCRALVYLTAALGANGVLSSSVWVGALGLLGYVVGLTHVAKQETKPPPQRRLWPVALLGTPLVFVLLHYWSLLTLLASSALVLWLVFSIRKLRSPEPGAIGKGVGALIAGISLVDALYVASTGAMLACAVCALGTPLTLALQEHVPGT